MKISKNILVISTAILLAGCNNSGSEETIVYTGNATDTFKISSISKKTREIQAVIVPSSLATVNSSIGGVVTELNCVPGTQVSKGTILAKIEPADDNAKQSALFQSDALSQQVRNLGVINNATTQSFGLQKDLLGDQIVNTERQLKLAKDNLKILEQQKTLSSGDSALQLQSLSEQLSSLQNSQSGDLAKIQKNIQTAKTNLFNSLQSSLKTVNDIFGITSKTLNSSYDIYISRKEPQLRSKVEQLYFEVNSGLPIIQSMDNNRLSEYMVKSYELFQNASQAINASISSSFFTQTSIDSTYKLFFDVASSINNQKSNIENLRLSESTVGSSYGGQITTLKISVANLSGNKIASSQLSMENGINSLKSQIAQLESSLAALQSQSNNLSNNKNIQTLQLSNQQASAYQNLNNVNLGLRGENLISPIDGVVRQVFVTKYNKISPNSVICQVLPRGNSSLKIQIFSPDKLIGGTQIFFKDGGKVIGSGMVEQQLISMDSQTQQRLYDITKFTMIGNQASEGKKIQAQVNIEYPADQIWIPLKFIIPRLEGYFVKKLNSTGNVEDQQVTVGNIDGDFIQVLSGLDRKNEISE